MEELYVAPARWPAAKLKASKAGTKHVLKVRAVLAGVVDATPSKKTFLVVKPLAVRRAGIPGSR